MQIIIPMSGIGKRFLEAGYTDPKPLIKVDGKSMIQHVHELFNNPLDIIFICNQKHVTENFITKEVNSFCEFAEYHILPEKGLGPVDDVSKIFNKIRDDDEIIVSYCDFGTVWDFDLFLQEARLADGAIACYTGFHPHMLGSDNYAYVKMENGLAIKVQEKKPFTDNKMNELASNGIYYFKSGAILKKYFQKLIDLDIKVNGEFYVSEVYNLLIEDGLKVVAPLIDKMLQWGTPYDLEVYKKWSDCFNYKKQEEKAICPPNTTLILPMAGRGSRFSEEGYKLPKPLIPVDGKPMYERAIECLPETKEQILITPPNFSLPSKYKHVWLERLTEGQACTCEQGIWFTNDYTLSNPILISACDNGVKYNHEIWNELVNDEDIDVIVWTFTNNPTVVKNPNMYSYVQLSKTWKDGTISNVSTKKCPTNKPMQTSAIIGTFFYRRAKDFLDGLDKNYKENIRTNGEFYVDDVINQNIKAGLKVVNFEVDHYICWGTPNDLKVYNYWSEYFGNK